MNISVHLRARNNEIIATFHDMEKEVLRVGVVQYLGFYYSFHSMDVKGNELHLFYCETLLMEVKV